MWGDGPNAYSTPFPFNEDLAKSLESETRPGAAVGTTARGVRRSVRGNLYARPGAEGGAGSPISRAGRPPGPVFVREPSHGSP